MSPLPKADFRFAMIGCGRMGRHHSEKLKLDGRGNCVALYDAFPDNAHSLQSEFWPEAVVINRFDDLLARSDVDAALICTPTAEHFEQTNGCLDRGWHVMCEKPLASNRQQILDLIEKSVTCRAHGQAFTLGYQRRFASEFRTLRREVLSGRWGKVRAIVSHNVEDWQSTIPGTWRDDPHQNLGGFITDAGSHKIDMLFYVTGLSPVQAFARSQKWGSQVEIVTSISALMTDDVTLTMDFVGNAQYFGEDLHVHCERGDLILTHGDLWIASNGRRERVACDEPSSHPVSGLIDVALGLQMELSPPAAALPVFDFTNAVLHSSRIGESVAIPVKNEVRQFHG